jgi:hypothetical protein
MSLPVLSGGGRRSLRNVASGCTIVSQHHDVPWQFTNSQATADKTNVVKKEGQGRERRVLLSDECESSRPRRA